MKELKFNQPDEETVEDWFEDSMDSFREENWIGVPEASMELHLLSGTRDIEAQSFGRLEPLLDNLRVLGCVKDIFAHEMLEYNHDETYVSRKNQINRAYAEEGHWEMNSYLESIYSVVPGRDVSLEFFSMDADIENLEYNTKIVEDIEKAMREDRDFSITGVELSASSEDNTAASSFNILQNSMGFDIYFLYGGDEELTQEYNEVIRQWGDQTEFSGVPGVVKVGKDRPIGYFFESQELSSNGSEVDSWLYDNLEPGIFDK